MIRQSRYDRLMQEIIQGGVRTKVLLLSATPVNNDTAGCSIAAHLPTLAPIDSLESLRSLFDLHSRPDHPLQRNLIQLQNLDLIKLIEGK